MRVTDDASPDPKQGAGGPDADSPEFGGPECPAEVARVASLVGSRICHDLASPLGAIANGVELFALSGQGDSPELQLIQASVSGATARLRLFRVAFGAAGEGQVIPPSEARAILAEASASGRIGMTWSVDEPVPRVEARLAFLLALCLESAMPFGGQIAISRPPAGWHLAATGQRFRPDAEMWSALRRAGATGGGTRDLALAATPAQVQFALAALDIAGRGLTLSLDLGETEMTLRL
jgi:histidine phosphotransferase ChpT